MKGDGRCSQSYYRENQMIPDSNTLKQHPDDHSSRLQNHSAAERTIVKKEQSKVSQEQIKLRQANHDLLTLNRIVKA